MVVRAIAETLRTTYGPKGMDKMLVDSLGDITITNDGATILDKMDVQHPTAKLVVQIAKYARLQKPYVQLMVLKVWTRCLLTSWGT